MESQKNCKKRQTKVCVLLNLFIALLFSYCPLIHFQTQREETKELSVL